MPITLTVPKGLLSAEAETKLFGEVTRALLEVSQLQGNSFMTPNVVGTLNVLPTNSIFVAGVPAAAVFVELKLPGIALASKESKQAFIEAATDAVERATGGKLPRERIWTNIVYAAEDAWGIAGRAYGHAELIGAIQAAAA